MQNYELTEPTLFEDNMKELTKIAKELEIENIKTLNKVDLIHKIFEMKAMQEGLAFITGCLEI
ncbi:MAG: Rho termination factor N-terminal domain-containing protein, partial [Candidatus Cloacimonetes bacterium]|nr:Rho termination factor N-terminal domain-containing protein [Candidatus Cloacimonadota bacterium]